MPAYFSTLPDFEYVSRSKDAKISDYVVAKNIFKKSILRSDIFQNLTFFTKYSIIGDERPDNIAYKFYNDAELDWVVLLSNNIIDFYNEWPLPETTFNNYLIKKYGSYEKLYDIHHRKTIEIKDSRNYIVLPGGLVISNDWEASASSNVGFININGSLYYQYHDNMLRQLVQVPSIDFIEEVTNYDHELELEEKKRNIYILKPEYLGVILNDAERYSYYKPDGDQFVNIKLKRADNIRLYQ